MAHLGGFSEEALQLYQLAASEKGYDFSEGEETYDFTRCMRPNGTYYGTRGKCKSGSEAGAKEQPDAKPKARKSSGETKQSAKAKSRPTGFGGETVEQLRAESDAAWKRARQLEKRAVADQAAWRKDPQNKDLLRKFQVSSMAVRNEEDRYRILKKKADKLEKEQAKEKDEPKAAPKVTATPGMAAKAKAAREKLGTEEAKPARKPRATVAETKPKWQEAERAVVDAKKKFREVEKETKGDQSVEARKRRLEAGRELDRAERAAEKAASRYGAAQKRESYAKMTPEQRKEEREWNKYKKTYG